MKIKFSYNGPKGEVSIDHTEIAGMSDAQIETYVAAKVRANYISKFEKDGIRFYMNYSESDFHTKNPSKEINEV